MPARYIWLTLITLYSIKSIARSGEKNVGTFRTQPGQQQREPPSPLLLTLRLAYAITKVQANREGLEVNGTHPLLVYTDKFIGNKFTY